MVIDSLPNQPLHYNWVDVTDEFFKAVKGMLRVGGCSLFLFYNFLISAFFLCVCVNGFILVCNLFVECNHF
jgi:hypothetical protein